MRPNLYDEVRVGDVTEVFRAEAPLSMIVAADSYIYFGDLDPLFESMGESLEDANGFVSKCFWYHDNLPVAFHPLVQIGDEHSLTLAGPSLNLYTTQNGEPCPIFSSMRLVFNFDEASNETNSAPLVVSLDMMADKSYFERYAECSSK